MEKNNEFLKMISITKKFPGVLALDNVNFSVELGKVTALVGENGAGKSTLIKIITGVHKKTAGKIYFDGKIANINTAQDALQLGINVIYQELNILPNLSIMENLFIGRENKKGIFVKKKYQVSKTKELTKIVGLNVDPMTKVGMLSTAQKQMVEVARALAFDAKIIIMDEPTSSLTNKETELLLGLIKELKKKGVGIIFVSHRINEITEIADRVAVLRDGKMVGWLENDEIEENKIINMMVGRELSDIFAKEKAEIHEVVMEVKDLSCGFVKGVNFSVRKGEILGFAGLVGAGRSEVMRAIFGIDKKDTGEIFINNKKVEINTSVDALKNKIGFIPEDRKEQALVLGMTVKQNISLPSLNNLKKNGFINEKAEKNLAHKYIDSLSIKTPSENQIVLNLSGGNQQKVVISKWMANHPKILILDEPTRGIDVGAKKEIHALMSELAKKGVAIIMISSELPEILGVSDRIIVMHEGRVKGEFLNAKDATQEKIMHMAIMN